MSTPAFDGYRITGELTTGTFSTVYRAVEEPLGRVVAIKALRSTMDPQSSFAEQFEREAHVLSRLSHPGILHLYRFVRTPSALYLVIEYVEGWSLRDLLKKKPSFGFAFAIALGLQVARALSHAHVRGVVHRDVKPANMLVNHDGLVKLADFGIARADDVDAQSSSAQPAGERRTFGTPSYMSPEQLLGEEVDARSDLFSLGVVLYQLSTGARPYEKGTTTAPSLRSILPDVPRRFDALVMKLIARHPDERPESAAQVVRELEALLSGAASLEPEILVREALEHAGLVKPSPKRVRLREDDHESKRRKQTWLPIGLVALGLTLGLVVGIVWPRRAAHAPERATLVPEHAGYLRIVASPWAEVWIDGERVDTTPFARALALAPGPHKVMLVHPEAKVDRDVEIAEGKTAFVDVTMPLALSEGGVP